MTNMLIILQLFRRIIRNEKRKNDHAFRLSYELDFGSSIDPNMMDVTEWEAELEETETPPPPEDLDYDDEELAALCEEYERHQEETEPWDDMFDDDDILNVNIEEPFDTQLQQRNEVEGSS